MFERFTDRARRVLVVAQDEARNLGHGFIGPEHLLLGLAEGDGLAAKALRQAGVDVDAMRKRVGESVAPTTGAHHLDKVPFSPRSKKVLELSLREALRLGHNYIGTEHVLLGLLRLDGEESDGIRLVLGVDPATVNERIDTVVKGLTPAATRSPAVNTAMDRARESAAGRPVTTGHLLEAILADPESQASKVLAGLGVTDTALAAALAGVDVADTSDAPPARVEVRVGHTATTIEDPELASALEGLTPAEIQAALKRALKANPGRRKRRKT